MADNALVTAALPLIEAHSINGTDSIILRSALDLATHLHTDGKGLVRVASDQRLLKAAIVILLNYAYRGHCRRKPAA